VRGANPYGVILSPEEGEGSSTAIDGEDPSLSSQLRMTRRNVDRAAAGFATEHASRRLRRPLDCAQG